MSKHRSPNEMNADLPPAHRSLPFALMRAREKVMAPIRDMLAASGITEQQWRVLRVLSENGAMDASKLADQASLLLPSLTRIAQNMVANGLITRATDTADRRRLVLAITAAGQTILDDNRAEAARIAQRFTDVLGRERLDSLLDALAMLDDL
jgi:homoprotocatechuate degradation regulator HpaR